jgi:N-sulfoglucosamine sulfohydrolase
MSSLLALLASLAFATPQVAQDERPNILILFADDLGRYASAYADAEQASVHDLIATPAFDQIAREGVLAKNAFVSAPSCTPSRAAMVSGRHFFRNGSCSQLHFKWNGNEPDPWMLVEGYGKLLAKANYHVGLTHKDHVKDKHFGPSFQSAGRSVNSYSQFVSSQDDIEQAKQTLDEECRQNFRAFLKGRAVGQPFLYSFHPSNPHRQWVRGSGNALWGIDPDALRGKLPPFLPDVPVVREDFADYLGEGMAFDRCCAVLIDELRRMGELDQTLVIISGDHGAPGFPRGKTNCYDFGARVLFAARWPARIKPGQVIDAPISLLDVAPTVLAAAGLKPSKEMNGQDLLPFLGKADHSGLRGWALIGREVHVGQARKGRLPYPSRAIRTANHLYVINFSPERTPNGDPGSANDAALPFEQLAKQTYAAYADIDASPTKAWMVRNQADESIAWHWKLGFGRRAQEELYVLVDDPYQVRNLADDPVLSKLKAQLRAQLMAELERWDDPRIRGDQFDRPPYLNK